MVARLDLEIHKCNWFSLIDYFHAESGSFVSSDLELREENVI